MTDNDIVVSLTEDVELNLQTVDIGTADEGDVIAFTIEGTLRGLNSDLVETVVGKNIIPTEIHFRIESE